MIALIKAKHSPAPWRATRLGGSVQDATGRVVAFIHDDPAPGERHKLPDKSETRKANARLIAAAPELLAMLKEIIPGVCPVVTHHQPDCDFCRALRLIAEIEGETYADAV